MVTAIQLPRLYLNLSSSTGSKSQGMLKVSQSRDTFESGGRQIRLDCFIPEGRGPFPAVIGLYGLHGGHAAMAEPGQILAEQGFAVFVLHYLDRSGPVECSKAAMMRHSPVWMKTLWDGVSCIHRRPDVDAGKTGLFGFSLGAYLGLASAAIDGRIAAVVEGFGGLPKEMKFFMRRFCPVLILHGETDPVVPVQEAYHLKEVLEARGLPYEMKIYPGVGHGFTGEIWEDALSRAVSFLKRYLA
jgi:carboxymethylenebutenolidase